jgi:hypothetical protein
MAYDNITGRQSLVNEIAAQLDSGVTYEMLKSIYGPHVVSPDQLLDICDELTR